eukprot:1847249-Heterocapsa_arctica.AAC.1
MELLASGGVPAAVRLFCSCTSVVKPGASVVRALGTCHGEFRASVTVHSKHRVHSCSVEDLSGK